MSEITLQLYWMSVLFGWALGVLTPFILMFIIVAVQAAIRGLYARRRRP